MEDSDESLHSFFNCLADELHERAKERLRDTLNRIEEVTKETEVRSPFYINQFILNDKFSCYYNILD